MCACESPYSLPSFFSLSSSSCSLLPWTLISNPSLLARLYPELPRPINMGSRILTFAKRYRPSLLVLASQMVAATLNTAAKVSETGSEAVHPFMILHIRMLITGLGSTLYLWINRPSRPEALFGNPDVQGLIFLRALGGVCSATGFFCTFCRCPHCWSDISTIAVKYANLTCWPLHTNSPINTH